MGKSVLQIFLFLKNMGRRKTPAEIKALQEDLRQKIEESSEDCALDFQDIIEGEFKKPDGVSDYSNEDICHFVAGWNQRRDTSKYPRSADAGRVVEILKEEAGIKDIDKNRLDEGIYKIQGETRENLTETLN